MLPYVLPELGPRQVHLACVFEVQTYLAVLGVLLVPVLYSAETAVS